MSACIMLRVERKTYVPHDSDFWVLDQPLGHDFASSQLAFSNQDVDVGSVFGKV